ncbi:unnamed protein product [Acanthoscelides obtectus]|uniref:Uncharacterized protein n=1 Tax=Acanthoscelides obtectus TaxID=200917 RepID=A0A9P0JQU7_ACAOB|nr:unnamed protein product [Acanthoscelides obtectus]CAK1642916.1 hypothetical protein AOBTE_LOCUS13291 [Acanthoscelides obtectus]
MPCFLCCVRACIVLVEDGSSFGVDFSKLGDDFGQTNGGIPIRRNSFLLIKRNCCNMTRFWHNFLLFSQQVGYPTRY